MAGFKKIRDIRKPTLKGCRDKLLLILQNLQAYLNSEEFRTTVREWLTTWRASILVLGVLALVILVYFFWQIVYTQKAFIKNVEENTRIVAEAVELHAYNAVLSQNVLEEVVQSFIENTARLVELMDMANPFTQEELADFAARAGLAGVTLYREREVLHAPEGWLPQGYVKNPGRDDFEPETIRTFTFPMSGIDGHVVVGVSMKSVYEMESVIGLKKAMAGVAAVEGIEYVKLLPPAEDGAENPEDKAKIRFIRNQNVAEARTVLDTGETLLVGVSTERIASRQYQLFRDFLMFCMLIALISVFFSWLIYRYQHAVLKQAVEYERRLARQQEHAALGRVSAIITHEIKNPLNAISMGLQRLKIEADDLGEEQGSLIDTMQQAVARTNSIINDLRRYNSPVRITDEDVNLSGIISGLVRLYNDQARHSGVRLRTYLPQEALVKGDEGLLSEVFENLLKNAIEAQSLEGFVDVGIEKGSETVRVYMENGGCRLSAADLDVIVEPYYTTKVKGTGMGLAIVSKIVDSHGGDLKFSIVRDNVFRVDVVLSKEIKGEDRESDDQNTDS